MYSAKFIIEMRQLAGAHCSQAGVHFRRCRVFVQDLTSQSW